MMRIRQSCVSCLCFCSNLRSSFKVSQPEAALAPQVPVQPHPICEIVTVYLIDFICESGTEGFSAPESYDDITREKSADVYSFAIIMYILRYGLRLWTLPHPNGQSQQYQERGLTARFDKCNRPPLSDAMVFREAPCFGIGAEAAPELRKAFSKSSVFKKITHVPKNNLAWSPEENMWKSTGSTGPLTPWHAIPSVESYVKLMYALAACALYLHHSLPQATMLA